MKFEDLYQEHKKAVFNLALHYVQNLEDAEEITQDVFVTVYEKLHTFRRDAKFSTWVYRITINKSLDFLKAQKRKKRFGMLSSLFSEQGLTFRKEPSDFNHPGIKMEQREEYQQLFQLINELPDAQKTTLLLLKVEGLSQQDVAAILNLSQKAVESLFQRAKTNLAKKIKQQKDHENKIV